MTSPIQRGEIARAANARLCLQTQIPLLPLDCLEALAMACSAMLPPAEGVPALSVKGKFVAIAAVSACVRESFGGF